MNTFTWYNDRVYKLEDDYDATDKIAAFQKSQEWGDKIPLGVIYKQDRPTFEEQSPALKEGPLFKKEVDYTLLDKLLEGFM